MPLNDGRWHQLAMSYDSARAEIRLYYDGQSKVSYNVADGVSFDFSTDEPLLAGWPAEPGFSLYYASLAAALATGFFLFVDVVVGTNST